MLSYGMKMKNDKMVMKMKKKIMKKKTQKKEQKPNEKFEIDTNIEYRDHSQVLVVKANQKLVDKLKPFVASDKRKTIKLDAKNTIKRFLVKKVILEEMKGQDNIYQIFFTPSMLEQGETKYTFNSGKDVYGVLDRMQTSLGKLIEIITAYTDVKSKKIKIVISAK